MDMTLYTAQQLGKQLMTENQLTGWVFKFDNARKRFGYCDARNKVISLSQNLVSLNDEARVKNTILHEIAHALAGPRAGHSYSWRIQARRIGCDARRLYNSEVVATPKGNFTGLCPNGHTTERFKKPKVGRITACGRCCEKYNFGRFSENYKITWTKN